MATSKDFNDEMEQLLECMICLERLNNPKVLNCEHSFCKTCLDTILKFRDDGSVVIKCPLRCTKKTLIDKNKTTNDLKAPVQFKHVIDLLAEKLDVSEIEEQRYKCHGYPNCKKIISLYCPVCCAKVCTSCKINHKHGSKVIKFVPIKYEIDSNELFPWCEKHATHATFVYQKEYICFYCKKRDHAEHRCDKIESLSKQIITWVQNQEKQPELYNMVQSSKETTEEEVKTIRDKLTSEIKNRKLICMKKLCEEEEKLLCGFDSIIANHFASYPAAKPTDFIENKPSFEVFANKENIFKGVKDMKTTSVFLPQLSFTFTKESMDHTHPLGEIQEYTDRTELINEQVTVSSSIDDTEVTNDVLQSLVKDLELLQQDLGINDPNVEGKKFNVESSEAYIPVNKRSVSLSSSGFHKLCGPVNGNECYFWRTTGCDFAQKCKHRHVPNHKGVDLQKVQAKYGHNATS